MRLTELKKEAIGRRYVLTSYDLAEKLKSKIIEFIKKECSIKEIIKYDSSVKSGIESKYDRLFEIFTTNYDTIIETYIETKGKLNEFYDGFTYLDPQRRIGDWNPKGYDKNDYKIKLLKLHGSIDQYIDKEGIIKNPPLEPRRLKNTMIYPMREKEIYKDPFFELFTRLKNCLHLYSHRIFFQRRTHKKHIFRCCKK